MLANNVTYYFAVSAGNVAGESALSNETSTTPRLRPPANPVVSGTALDRKARLSWPSVAQARSYNVYLRTVKLGEADPVPPSPSAFEYKREKLDSPTFDWDTLENGRTYLFSVTAVNEAGESVASNVVSVIPSIPGVASIFPARDAVEVALDTGVNVKFNDAIDEQSARASFRVKDVNGLVEGTIGFEGKTLTFTPQEPLARAAKYQVELTDARSINGNLIDPLGWAFTTRDGQMQTATKLEVVNTRTASSVRMASNSTGTTVVVWVEYRDSSSNDDESVIVARFLRSNGGWGPAQMISRVEGRVELSTGALAIADNGNAVLAWCTGRSEAHAAYYSSEENLWTSKKETGCSTEVAPSGNEGDISASITDRGVAIIAWVGSASEPGIWIKKISGIGTGPTCIVNGLRVSCGDGRSDSLSHWHTKVQVPRTTLDAREPIAIIADYDTFMISWKELNSSESTVKAMALKFNSGWGENSIEIAALSQSGFIMKALYETSSNSVLFVWFQDGSFGYTLSMGRLGMEMDGQFSSEGIPVVPYPVWPLDLSLAISSNGDALIAWQDYRPWDNATIYYYAITHNAELSKWSTVIDLGQTNDEIRMWRDEISTAIDPQGKAVVAWTKRASRGEENIIWSREFDGEWKEPVALTRGMEHVASPSVTIDNLGNILSTWIQTTDQQTATGQPLYRARFKQTDAEILNRYEAINPNVGIDNVGTAAIVYEQWSGEHIDSSMKGDAIIGQAYTSNDGWQEPTWLNWSVSGSSYDIAFAGNTKGRYVAAWANDQTGQKGQLLYSTLGSLGWKSNPINLSNYRDNPDIVFAEISNPRVVLTDNNDATILWNDKVKRTGAGELVETTAYRQFSLGPYSPEKLRDQQVIVFPNVFGTPSARHQKVYDIAANKNGDIAIIGVLWNKNEDNSPIGTNVNTDTAIHAAFSARYSATNQRWTDATYLSNTGVFEWSSNFPIWSQTFLDDIGNQLVTSSPLGNGLIFNRYDALRKIWDEPSWLTGIREFTSDSVLTGNSRGEAIVAWFQQTWGSTQSESRLDARYTQGWNAFLRAPSSLRVNHYIPGKGWTGAQSIAPTTTGTTPSRYPKIAMDETGNAIVVWVQIDEAGQSLLWNRYTVDHGWRGPQTLPVTPGRIPHAPTIAMNAKGRAIIAWEEHATGLEDSPIAVAFFE